MRPTPWMDRETVLRRAKRGNTYHRTGCPRAGNTLPWLWAEGKTRAEVEESHVNGLRPCKVCDPLAFLPTESVPS